MNLQIPTINSRLVNSIQKRQIMWNIIEPGDPYDIRKSMIAKLPGRKSFMGDHLQLVCLLQAAEIERLCEYLDQYKLKFRQVQRRELDRHSYEVQIKELTQRISEEGNFKAENLKLRQFLRKQSNEFEQLKKKFAGLNNENYQAEFSRKYEDSLKQIQNLRRENSFLLQSNNKIRIQFQQASMTKNVELQQLQRLLREGNAMNISSGRGQAFYKLQIEFKKSQFENKRLKEINQSKNRQIQELQNKSKQLIYRLEEYQVQLRQFHSGSMLSKQAQGKLYMLGQQIQRLNMVLRDKIQQANEWSLRCKMFEDENSRLKGYISQIEQKRMQLQEVNRQLQRKLIENMNSLNMNSNLYDENKNVIKTYEFKLEKLSGQIQRLNSVLKKKVVELDDKERRVSELEFQAKRTENLRKELEDYRGKIGQFGRKVAEYENRVGMLAQEIERLNQVLKRKNDDIYNLQQKVNNKSSEHEFYQKQNIQIEQQFKSKVSYLTSTYESKIADLNRQNDSNRSKMQEMIMWSSKLQQSNNDKQYQIQIERLNIIINNKNDQIAFLQQQSRSSPSKDSIEIQRKKLIMQYQSQINNRNRDYEQVNASLAQYQQRIMLLSKEIDRLNDLLKKASISVSPAKIQPQIDHKRLAQYENKLAIFNQEIQRLNEVIRVRDNKLKSYELQIQNIQKNSNSYYENMIAEYKRKEKQSSLQLDNTRQELRTMQQSLSRNSSEYQMTSNINKDNESKIKQLYDENNGLSRKLTQFEYQLTSLSHEIERLNGVLKVKVDQNASLEQRYRTSTRESDDLRRKLSQYETRLSLLNQQTENIKTNYQLNTQFEIDNYKRRIKDFEKKAFELEGIIRELQNQNRGLDQQIKTFDQQLKYTSGESQQLRNNINEANRKYSQYENKITIFSKEIQRLNNILQKINKENQELRRFIVEFQHNQTTLQQRLSRSSQQNDQLNKRINEITISTQKMVQQYDFKLKQVNNDGQQYYKRSNELQTKINYLVQEVQYANSVTKDRNQAFNALEIKWRNSQQENQTLNRRIQELSNANRKIGQYDSKIALLSQEIQRLNHILKSKIEQLHLLQNKNRSYETQITNYQRRINDFQNNITRELQSKNTYLLKENQDFKQRNKQLSQECSRIPQLQNKMQLIMNEVERLNTNLRLKSEEMAGLENRCRSFEGQLQRSKRRSQQLEYTLQRQLKNQSLVFEQRINSLSQQNEQLRRVLRQAHDVNRHIPQYQNKIALLSSQIDRLNEILAKFNKEVVPSLQEKNRGLFQENETLKRRLNQFSKAHEGSQQAISKLTIIAQENQQNIRRIQDYQIRMSQISSQIQRLNTVLRSKLQQLNNAQLRIRQTQMEIEQLNRHLKDSSQGLRRIPQYQNKINVLSQQIQRLNGILRVKVNELNSAENRVQNLQNEMQLIKRKLIDYENGFADSRNYRSNLQEKIKAMNMEIEEYRRNIRELSDSNRRIADYQSKIALLSQQIERLNGHLRLKMQELSSSQNIQKNQKRQAEAKLNNLNLEFEEYRRKLGQNMNMQSSRIADYQNKITILSQEIERLNYVLKESTYQLQNYNKKQNQFLQEIERLNNTLRLKVEETSRWEQANIQYKNRFKQLEQALHLSNTQQQKSKYQLTTLTEEYNKNNKHLVEYQQSINKLYLQFQRLQNIIQGLKKENYQLKVKLQQFGNLVQKNRVLSDQIDRLIVIIEQQTRDLEELRLSLSQDSSLQKRLNEDMGLMVVLFAQIESLRKRVKDTEKQIETVRRSSLAPFKV